LVEKYRPKSFDEIKGQDEIVAAIKRMVERKDLPHLLFIGPPGTGKTSMAECIARALFGSEWRNRFVELNASDERGIDTVRNVIKRLARTSGKRILFLDEADAMTPDAQNALRRIMEKTQSTIFILSANREWKIIDAIKSRCAIFRFKKLRDDIVLQRLLEICKAEGIKIDPKAKEGFMALVREADGDLRKAINMLETLITHGKSITEKEVLALRRPRLAEDALKLALGGDFDRAREMLEDAYINGNLSADKVVDELYEALSNLNPLDNDVRVRLYARLAEAERAIRLGANPLIQLVGFLAYAWVAPHLRKCPLLGEVK
jgi:replication factor C small subunit